MAEGVDYAWSRPRPWVLASAGKSFALRYAGPGSSGKHMSAAEVDALAAAGLRIGTLCEGSPRDPLLGRGKGIDHARAADEMAWIAGMPPGRPIYFAVDFDASSAELAACAAYFDGAASVIGLYRVGIYGGYRTIDWAARGGHAAKFFQTYAWSAGKVHPRADLMQYHNGATIDGGSVDLCRSLSVDWGGWRPGSEEIGEAPTQAPPTGTTDWWDYAPAIDTVAGQLEDLAASLEGSARQVEAAWTG